MTPTLNPRDYEVITAIKACAHCGKPVTVQMFRGRADAPHNTALHLGCAMALEGH